MSMDFSKPKLFAKVDGQSFEFDEMDGLHFLDLRVDAPQTRTNLQSNDYQDGSRQQGPILFGARTVAADFYFEANDLHDFELATQEIWRRLYSRNLIELRWSRMPGIKMAVIAKPFEQTRLNWGDMKFTVEFDMPSGYRQSLVKSDQLQFIYDEELSQIGMNLPNGEDLHYRFKQTRFKVYNPSDVVIDPYWQKHDLDIIIKGQGTPTMTNLTNNYGIVLNRALTANDTLIWHGVHPLLNGASCERATNHGHLQLEKGWNDISITGLSNIDVTFSFPFLYL
ncbi:phage tail family protein [Latilactobacillus curvatus]|nr:phage tail family protein [Latilactobacillus curvatus]